MFTVRATLRLFVLGFVYPLFISGCSPTLQWVRTEAETGGSDQQQAACALQAEQSYLSSEESAEARASRLARWTSLCMKASGFKQQEVEQ